MRSAQVHKACLVSFPFASSVSVRRLSDKAASKKAIKEGLATIRGLGNNDVFYNPAQCANRDISVAMIQAYVDLRREEHAAQQEKANKLPEGKLQRTMQDAPPFHGITIYEALAASGLRSIRYFKEINGISQVIANDLDPHAIQTISENVKQNGLTDKQVTANLGDCNLEMHRLRGLGQMFDVIDLDPYGSSSPYLDAAVQGVAEGGLLCVTCTDLAVLCGNCPEVAFSKYGATPVKASYMHEAAVRIVLQSIAQTAARYKRVIQPLGSFFIDFYLRCFVRVHTSPLLVKNLGCQLSLVYQCVSCDTFALQQMMKKATTETGNSKFTPNHGPAVPQKCPECSSRFVVGGPIWSDSMHDRAFLSRALQIVAARAAVMEQAKKISGILTVASEELPDSPLFYSVHSISGTVKCHAMSAIRFRSSLLNSGYSASQSHTDPMAVKTNAPNHVIWNILRAWCEMPQSSHGSPKTNTTASKILSNPISSTVDLTVKEESRITGSAPRFVHNPENWGPKKAAAGGRFVGLNPTTRKPKVASGNSANASGTQLPNLESHQQQQQQQQTQQQHGQQHNNSTNNNTNNTTTNTNNNTTNSKRRQANAQGFANKSQHQQTQQQSQQSHSTPKIK